MTAALFVSGVSLSTGCGTDFDGADRSNTEERTAQSTQQSGRDRLQCYQLQDSITVRSPNNPGHEYNFTQHRGFLVTDPHKASAPQPGGEKFGSIGIIRGGGSVEWITGYVDTSFAINGRWENNCSSLEYAELGYAFDAIRKADLYYGALAKKHLEEHVDEKYITDSMGSGLNRLQCYRLQDSVTTRSSNNPGHEYTFAQHRGFLVLDPFKTGAPRPGDERFGAIGILRGGGSVEWITGYVDMRFAANGSWENDCSSLGYGELGHASGAIQSASIH